LGALKTTVGMFFTPGGSSTQHKGVDADIVFPSAYSTDEIGEKTLDYSLPPKKLAAFKSNSAYVSSGPEKWDKINSSDVLKLKTASEVRVKDNADFKKLVENINKSKEKGRIIKVAEILDKTKKDDKKDEKVKKSPTSEVVVDPLDEEDEDSGKVLTKQEKLEKYRKRADIQESLNVLADLVTLKRNAPITIGKSTPNSKEKENPKN
jgi:carboxyl-terminal processing protease